MREARAGPGAASSGTSMRADGVPGVALRRHAAQDVEPRQHERARRRRRHGRRGAGAPVTAAEARGGVFGVLDLHRLRRLRDLLRRRAPPASASPRTSPCRRDADASRACRAPPPPDPGGGATGIFATHVLGLQEVAVRRHDRAGRQRDGVDVDVIDRIRAGARRRSSPAPASAGRRCRRAAAPRSCRAPRAPCSAARAADPSCRSRPAARAIASDERLRTRCRGESVRVAWLGNQCSQRVYRIYRDRSSLRAISASMRST